MSIATRVKQAREYAGFSQPELGRRCGVTKAAIWNIENGQTKSPTPETLFAIADNCKVRERWIIEGTGAMTEFERNADGTIKDIESLVRENEANYSNGDVLLFERIQKLSATQKAELASFIDYLESK